MSDVNKENSPNIISLDVKPAQILKISPDVKSAQILKTSAIKGTNISFRYGRKEHQAILKDVDIHVHAGTIYGLLGPSGCGKTTLLKCVIGVLKPQYGNVRIFGKRLDDPSLCIPGNDIGYMPQDLALYPDITIKETLLYFGNLYFMTKHHLKIRIQFLLDLLEIPQKNILVRNLSEGQQRRVSFACALIHQPPLLLLDEPTVGVDPLLRYSIWEYLKKIAAENHTTIIITTHYVEEARKANTVALMKNGRLLAEANPEILILRNQVDTLEKVFWKLCKKEKSAEEDTKNGNFLIQKSEHNSDIGLSKTSEDETLNVTETPASGKHDDEDEDVGRHFLINNRHEMDSNRGIIPTNQFTRTSIRMMALIKKSFTCLRRNALFAIFQTLIPAVFFITFYFCIGGVPFDLKIAVVNNETNTLGHSQMFLHTLSNKTFKQIHYTSLPNALDSVKNGETFGVIFFDQRFGNALTDRILEGTAANNETIQASKLKLYLDFTNQQAAFTISAQIAMAFQSFTQEMLTIKNENPYLSEPVLSLEDPIYGKKEMDFSEFANPGFILGLTNYFAIILTVIPLFMEKKGGQLNRCLVAGVSAAEIVGSIMIVFLITMVAQVALLFIVALVILDTLIKGSIFWVIVCAILAGINGMAIGLFLSIICSNETVAIILGCAFFCTSFILSGLFWPLQALPDYMRYISYTLPLTFLGDSIRSVAIRGWTITEHYAWIGCASISIWTTTLLVISIFVFKYKISKEN